MKKYSIFILFFIVAVILDQYVKNIFVNGFFLETNCINLELHYNRGVAFSMLSFLEDNLKWIQVVLLIGVFIYIIKEKYIHEYPFALAMILSGGISNLYDRFIHIEGVVDYIFWHCGFNFAIFNIADILINLGAFIILLSLLLVYIKEKNANK